MPEAVPEISLGDRLFASLQYLLPKQALSRIVHRVMRNESPMVKRLIIKNFMRGYTINMAEAVQTDPLAYRSFNDFFTRALQPTARPIAAAPDAVVSPVDGTVSQCGPIHGETIIQAKGQSYSLTELLAGDANSIAAYRDGSFACIYLAPYNYHRIHMPFSASLRSTVYVPGDLFSVNAATARAVPRLFARNERVICDFDTTIGRMAVILVGALFVGSMETVYAGEINPPPRPKLGVHPIAKGIGTSFGKGAELGRFNMGSTVVMLFQRDAVNWQDTVVPQARVRLGQIVCRARS